MGKNTTTWTYLLKDRTSGVFSKISNKMKKTNDKFSSFEKKGSKAFDRVGRKAKIFMHNNSQMFDQLSGQLPMLSKGFSALASPIGIAVAGLALLATVGFKAVGVAQEYNNTFLELKQLNLEKPVGELDKLNTAVLNNAFRTGQSAKDTSKAYFDIQSATGKYGLEVDRIVEKTANFALSTKTDFDTMVNGAAKAMNAFGFGADEMDDFLASSFKTVQVGITTFDQLAQVQTDYAGAAAAAGQDFNNANKLFAVFTTKSKSVAEAATLTKTAFQDLTKGSTIKGFKKLGVNVFDAEGKMRSMDSIVRDLVPKMKSLSDQKFSKLKEEIGGSEGIKALLDSVKSSGDAMITTFDTFDNTKFDALKALDNAKGDLKIMKTILGNQVNNLMVRLGQKLIPTVIRGTQMLVSGITNVWNFLQKVTAEGTILSDVFTVLGKASTLPFNLIKGHFNFIMNAWTTFKSNMNEGAFSGLFNGIKSVFSAIKNEFIKFVAVANLSMDIIGATLSGNFEKAGKKSSQLMAVANMSADKFVEIKNKHRDKKAAKDKANSSLLPDGSAAIGGAGGGGIGTNIKDGLAGVGEAKGNAPRHITVRIEKLIENISITPTTLREGVDEIVEMVEEGLIRAIRNTEQTISSS